MCRCFDSSCLWWTLDLCWNNPLCCLTKPEFWLVSRSNSVYNSGFPSNHHIIQFTFPYFPVINRIPLQRFLFSGSLGLRVWTEDGKISVRLGSSHRPIITILQDAKKMWRWCFSPYFSRVFHYFPVFYIGFQHFSTRTWCDLSPWGSHMKPNEIQRVKVPSLPIKQGKSPFNDKQSPIASVTRPLSPRAKKLR